LNGITKSGNALVLPVTGTYQASYIVNATVSTGTYISMALLKGNGGNNYTNITGSATFEQAPGAQLMGQAQFSAAANDYVELSNNTIYSVSLPSAANAAAITTPDNASLQIFQLH
jgi:hypothetical protein